MKLGLSITIIFCCTALCATAIYISDSFTNKESWHFEYVGTEHYRQSYIVYAFNRRTGDAYRFNTQIFNPKTDPNSLPDAPSFSIFSATNMRTGETIGGIDSLVREKVFAFYDPPKPESFADPEQTVEEIRKRMYADDDNLLNQILNDTDDDTP